MHETIPPFPQHAFMGWCSVKAERQIYFHLFIKIEKEEAWCTHQSSVFHCIIINRFDLCTSVNIVSLSAFRLVFFVHCGLILQNRNMPHVIGEFRINCAPQRIATLTETRVMLQVVRVFTAISETSRHSSFSGNQPKGAETNSNVLSH